MGYMKPISSGDLRYENGEIEHETWEFQIVRISFFLLFLSLLTLPSTQKLAESVHSLISQDEAEMPKGKGGAPSSPHFLDSPWLTVPSSPASARNIATYVVPYVPGFDQDHLLELKPGGEAKEEYAWSKVQRLQYAVK